MPPWFIDRNIGVQHFNNDESLAVYQALMQKFGAAMAELWKNGTEVAVAAETVVSARLTVRARDQNGKVLFEEKEVASRGLHSLTLPPDLPYRPNTRLDLEVSAVPRANSVATHILAT